MCRHAHNTRWRCRTAVLLRLSISRDRAPSCSATSWTRRVTHHCLSGSQCRSLCRVLTTALRVRADWATRVEPRCCKCAVSSWPSLTCLSVMTAVRHVTSPSLSQLAASSQPPLARFAPDKAMPLSSGTSVRLLTEAPRPVEDTVPSGVQCLRPLHVTSVLALVLWRAHGLRSQQSRTHTRMVTGGRHFSSHAGCRAAYRRRSQILNELKSADKHKYFHAVLSAQHYQQNVVDDYYRIIRHASVRFSAAAVLVASQHPCQSGSSAARFWLDCIECVRHCLLSAAPLSNLSICSFTVLR